MSEATRDAVTRVGESVQTRVPGARSVGDFEQFVSARYPRGMAGSIRIMFPMRRRRTAH